jgi:hypothetical protein
MAEYEEVNDVVEVPKNTGVQGFLKTVEEVLKLPRVQEIRIDARGRVNVRYFVREGEQKKPFGMDFETLLPYAIIRNNPVIELVDVDANAAIAIGQLFDLAAADHLFPVAFVGGPASLFWQWYETTTGFRLTSHEELYGVPFLSDRALEDYVLVLCAAYTRGAALIDTQRSYKLVIPQVQT